MSRKKINISKYRQIGADPLHKSKVISKVINCFMIDGKKSIAAKIVYQALDYITQKHQIAQDEAMAKIMAIICPTQELKKLSYSHNMKVVSVTPQRSQMLGIRLLKESIKEGPNEESHLKLAKSMDDILTNKGYVIKKKEELERLIAKNSTVY